MKALIKHSVLALAVIAAGYNVAMADPVNIKITGKVISSPCVVNNGKSDLDVDLGQSIGAATLATANAGTPPKDFNLVLTDCPTGTKNVTVKFTGTAAASPQTDMYENTGTATPLAVELTKQGTTTRLGNASELTQAVQGDKSVTYALSARAVTATGILSPGDISAVVQANFTYN